MFNTHSLATQAKKKEHLASMMSAIKKAFDLMYDNLVEFSTENDFLINKIGCYHERWLEESMANFSQNSLMMRKEQTFLCHECKAD